ncbi:hypothetical protein ABZ864_09070 [Streptomyces sp. NPDC047082]|uniref:hypothetical protein n=1 Tax=Streptomyces sp. NPDC047082 TaxID=3155259 RepID=UPI0033C21B3E
MRGLPGLRDEYAFRPWLVTVTMNQILGHRQSASASERVLQEPDAVADPGADFVTSR